MSDEKERFESLQKSIRELETRKIRLEEQFKNKKQALNDIVKKIKDAGFEPKELKKVIQEKTDTVNKKMDVIEAQLKEAETKLSSIEG